MNKTPFHNLSLLANGRSPEQLVFQLPRLIKQMFDDLSTFYEVEREPRGLIRIVAAKSKIDASKAQVVVVPEDSYVCEVTPEFLAVKLIELLSGVIAECRVLVQIGLVLNELVFYPSDHDLPDCFGFGTKEQLQKIGNLCLGAIRELEEIATDSY